MPSHKSNCAKHSSNSAKRWLISGHVQSVGFRPYVFKLAQEHDLHGWVKNLADGVEIIASGNSHSLAEFENALLLSPPPLARPRLVSCDYFSGKIPEKFSIQTNSNEKSNGHGYVLPDFCICDDCLQELHDPNNRRYRYPFINCTQCGPRYTVINSLPYARCNTTMHSFELCPACATEYNNPADRRFHAEPIACPDCGPTLEFRSGNESVRSNTKTIDHTIKALREGKIVAAKGIGGYHLMCDAHNEEAVARLRERKKRPDKPFAVLFPRRGSDDLTMVRQHADTDDISADMLCHARRPIVLVPKADTFSLATNIAPRLNQLGVMLPHSPLQELISNDFDGPLIATSANISGEPVLITESEVERHLNKVADAFLHHDREIIHPADDSVFSTVSNKSSAIRLGRGIAPLELELPFELSAPILALGCQMKNTVAMAWDKRVVISPHIGELGSARSISLMTQIIKEMQNFYNVTPQIITCDAHPGFSYQQWLKNQEAKVIKVLHHHAHASALTGENNINEPLLVFTWDGLGYGDDESLWGGETFYGQPGQWHRVASFRPWKAAGGDKVPQQPWRSAAALHWSNNQTWQTDDTDMAYQAWQKDINCHNTTAVGRLFDAAAATLGLVNKATFEAHAPSWLESIAEGKGRAVTLPIEEDTQGIWRTDWQPLLELLNNNNSSIKQRSADFHSTLAENIIQQALLAREKFKVNKIGLSGGVFQNRRLSDETIILLEQHGFEAITHSTVPCNDAGISYGQIIEAINK